MNERLIAGRAKTMDSCQRHHTARSAVLDSALRGNSGPDGNIKVPVDSEVGV